MCIPSSCGQEIKGEVKLWVLSREVGIKCEEENNNDDDPTIFISGGQMMGVDLE